MKKGGHSGFTIVEMLVVIGIMVLLIALLLPTLRGVRAEAHSTQCLSNLRQIFLAVEGYRQTTDGLLPFAKVLPTPTPAGPIDGLNGALQYILPQDSECYRCPADFTQDAEDLNTSYSYGPGGFMAFWLLQSAMQPQYADLPQFELHRLASRHVTQLYETGFLRGLPILIDSQPRHAIGERLPENVVFLDGMARARKPQDDDISFGGSAPGPGTGATPAPQPPGVQHTGSH